MANDWLSSREASRRLGVSAATLYAYVSRGLLRWEAVDGRRERRYRADDISRLKRRRDVGRKAESIANHALDFGTPVLESALTLIQDGRLYYPGLDPTAPPPGTPGALPPGRRTPAFCGTAMRSRSPPTTSRP